MFVLYNMLLQTCFNNNKKPNTLLFVNSSKMFEKYYLYLRFNNNYFFA